MVWSCNNCARLCNGFGGWEATKALCSMLAEDGLEVVGGEVSSVSCFKSIIRKRLDRADFRMMVEMATHLTPLTCRTGVEMMRNELPWLEIVEVGETVGLGYLSERRGRSLRTASSRCSSFPRKGSRSRRSLRIWVYFSVRSNDSGERTICSNFFNKYKRLSNKGSSFIFIFQGQNSSFLHIATG